MAHIGLLLKSQSVFTGPLDSLTANLWGAFAFKRLLSLYTGPLIRVRRSSDNAEQDIGYLTDGSLDTAALASFVGANSAFIVIWYDQAGSANDLSQATAANQARIVNSGAYDGKAVLDTTDYWSTATSIPASSKFAFYSKLFRHGTASTNVYFSTTNLLTGGFNGLQGYSNAGQNDVGGFVGTSGTSNFRLTLYLPSPDISLATAVIAWLFDRALVTSAKIQNAQNGSLLSPAFSTTLAGTDPIGNFSADTLLVGAQGGLGAFADSDMHNLVVYSDTAGSVSAISAALA